MMPEAMVMCRTARQAGDRKSLACECCTRLRRNKQDHIRDIAGRVEGRLTYNFCLVYQTLSTDTDGSLTGCG